MDSRDVGSLREHFDSSDLSGDIDSAKWDTEVESDPMIVTSVRLPKSLLEWVREQAATEQLKPTALIRRWIEDQRRASAERQLASDRDAVAGLAERVSRLEAVALRVVAADQGADDTSMGELLAALRASVDKARERERPSDRAERRGA